MPSFTFAATANSVALTGATPVFADIEPDDFCLDPAAVEAAITDAHRGRSCRCTSTGTRRRWTSSWRSPSSTACRCSRTPRRRTARRCDGDAGRRVRRRSRCSRLYPTKNMTSGEGGMVSVRGRRDRARCAAATQPGHGAAVRERGRRLQHPDDRHPRRHRPGAADQGRRLDRAAPGERGVPRSANLRGRDDAAGAPTAPCTSTTSTRSAWPRTATASRPRCASEHSVGSGMSTTRCPNHRLPPFQASTLDLPETERAAAEVLSLPVHPSLTSDDLERIVDGGQHPREGGCVMAQPARRPDRPGHDGPPPRPGARGRWTGVDLVAVADPGGDPHGVARRPAGAGRRRGADRGTGIDYCMVAVPTVLPRGGRAGAGRGRRARPDREAAGAGHRRGGAEAGRGVRGRRPGRRGRAHRAVQPGAAAGAGAAGGRRARRRLPGRPPAGRARSRPGSPTSGSSRTWPPTTST